MAGVSLELNKIINNNPYYFIKEFPSFSGRFLPSLQYTLLILLFVILNCSKTTVHIFLFPYFAGLLIATLYETSLSRILSKKEFWRKKTLDLLQSFYLKKDLKLFIFMSLSITSTNTLEIIMPLLLSFLYSRFLINRKISLYRKKNTFTDSAFHLLFILSFPFFLFYKTEINLHLFQTFILLLPYFFLKKDLKKISNKKKLNHSLLFYDFSKTTSLFLPLYYILIETINKQPGPSIFTLILTLFIIMSYLINVQFQVHFHHLFKEMINNSKKNPTITKINFLKLFLFILITVLSTLFLLYLVKMFPILSRSDLPIILLYVSLFSFTFCNTLNNCLSYLEQFKYYIYSSLIFLFTFLFQIYLTLTHNKLDHSLLILTCIFLISSSFFYIKNFTRPTYNYFYRIYN